MIEDGKINICTLESERLSQSELFDSLRSQGIVHVGQIRAAYLERSGKVSVIESDTECPGFFILPHETGAHEHADMSGSSGQWCCSNCGKLVEPTTDRRVCVCCGSNKQVRAVLEQG